MDIYKLKFTKLQNEIFRLLCIKSGKKISQRQIAKMLKVSPTAISKSISILEKENLIKIEKDNNIKINYLSLNRDSEKTINFKKVENLKMIYELELNNFLENAFPGSAIILFGSYSRGDDIFDSDIDIAVIGRKKKEINLEKFENLLEREIILQFYNEFKNIHEHLKNNILNGILIGGNIKL